MEEAENKFLFILSPPFSGTTLLWNILGSSPNVSSHPNEGQFLDGARQEMRGNQWDSEKEIDWDRVEDVWRRHWDPSKAVLLEKSPPNLLRASELGGRFDPAYFIVMMRNPYAFIEGVERRDNDMGARAAAELWVKCASAQRNNQERLKRTISFTYKSFTESPRQILDDIIDFMPDVEKVNVDKIESQSFLGTHSKIQNMNPMKINRLDRESIESANEVLDGHQDLLSHFGFELRNPARHSQVAKARTRLAHLIVRAIRYRDILPEKLIHPLERWLLGKSL